jgi:hypothetical protein
MRLSLHRRGSRQRRVVAGEVVEHAVRYDEDVLREIERSGYYEEGEEEEKKGV